MNALSPIQADALATTALSSANPDAGLIAACARFDALERRANQLIEDRTSDDDQEEAIDALHEAQAPFLEAICAQRAKTIEGQRARVQSLLLEDLDLNPAEDAKYGCRNTRITAAILRDLAVERPTPDAELIAVCAEFDDCDRRYRGIHDGPGAIEDDDEAEAAARPILARQNQLLDQMERLRAATREGIVARAISLAQHSGDWAFDFGARGTVSNRLLAYLMRDAVALDQNEPRPDPDAGLLSLHAEFRQAVEAVVAYDNATNERTLGAAAQRYDQAHDDALSEAAYAAANTIMASAPQTPMGQRIKAAAALYLVRWRLAGDGDAMDEPAQVLIGMAGEFYVPMIEALTPNAISADVPLAEPSSPVETTAETQCRMLDELLLRMSDQWQREPSHDDEVRS